MSEEKLKPREWFAEVDDDTGAICHGWTYDPDSRVFGTTMVKVREVIGPDESTPMHELLGNQKVHYEAEIARLREALKNARVSAIEECVNEVRRHQELPLRNDAFKAACRDIIVSLEAAISRINRGEDFNPFTRIESLMKGEKE